jgi:hypothetical protein
MRFAKKNEGITPQETIIPETRVRFPSPAPFFFNWLDVSASKVQVIRCIYYRSHSRGWPGLTASTNPVFWDATDMYDTDVNNGNTHYNEE